MWLVNTVNKTTRTVRRARQVAKARAAHFGHGEDGSLLLFGMIIFILMLWSLGLAVDAMRVENARTLVQQTLDRAVLAAADLDQTEDPKTVVEDYFAKAGISEYLDGVTVTSSNGSSALSFRRVSASATARVDSMFMDLLGVEYMNAVGASTAEEGIGELEISLVLDVSGSMGWSSSSGNTKIKDMQDAAKDFSWMMLCNPNAELNPSGNCSVDPGSVSISLISYAEQVYVGQPLMEALNDPLLSPYTLTEEHISSWCVNFETEDYETISLSDDDFIDKTGHFDPWRGASDTPGSWVCPEEKDDWRQIRPYVGHHSNLNYLIGNLRAGGNTSIDIAMKWATSLLDPALRPVIQSLATTDRVGGAPATEPDFSGRPIDYSNPYNMKVIVLMTDGVNTNQHYLKQPYRSGNSPIWRYTDPQNKEFHSIYNAATDQYYFTGDGKWYDEPFGNGTEVETTTVHCTGSWWRGRRCTYTTTTSTAGGSVAVQMQYPEVWERFTTEWFASWSWLDDPVLYHDNPVKDNRLSDICEIAKSKGMIVYTIGFEAPSSGEDVLRDCATTPGHYFKADGVNLAEVFQIIAISINKLRLVQ